MVQRQVQRKNMEQANIQIENGKWLVSFNTAEKDLGATVDSKLNIGQYCNIIGNKTNNILMY